MDLGTAVCPLSFSYRYRWNFCGSEFSSREKASAGIMTIFQLLETWQVKRFRDLEWEKTCSQICQESSIGTQFGGKYLTHDVRVIRLPRHAASCRWEWAFLVRQIEISKEKSQRRYFLRTIRNQSSAILPETAPHLDQRLK